MAGYTETDKIRDNGFIAAWVVTTIWMIIGIVFDVGLLRKKVRLMSDVFRTKTGLVILTVFYLHILDKLGRLDPFKAAGNALTRRYEGSASLQLSEELAVQ